MELRKVEQELDHLAAEWKALRRKRPRFADGVPDESGVALSSRMPSWTELRSRVKDEDIFPPEEEVDEMEGDIAIDTGDDAVNEKGESGTDATNGGEAGDADETAGYSEFGMCLASGGNAGERAEGTGDAAATGSGGSIFERYAAKSATVTKPKAVVKQVKVEKEAPPPTVVDEEVEMTVEDASPADVLAALESLKERFAALRPKVDKFVKKLNDVSDMDAPSFAPLVISLSTTSNSLLSTSSERSCDQKAAVWRKDHSQGEGGYSDTHRIGAGHCNSFR